VTRVQQRGGSPPDFVVLSAPPANAAVERKRQPRDLQPGWDEVRTLPHGAACCMHQWVHARSHSPAIDGNVIAGGWRCWR